jgi:hypothetical protein
MSEAPPRVLLDATAIIENGFGKSGHLRHLLREAAEGNVEVIVPELAIAETVFVYRRELSDNRRALKRLPRLLNAAGHAGRPPKPAALLGEMEKQLRASLAEAGITPTPAPLIDGDQIVTRILERRKPTKPLIEDDGQELPEQGEGFRDQLFWAHVRAAAKAEPLVFVSKNVTDFAEKHTVKDGRAKLHPDLRADLAADRRNGALGQVELFLDLPAFMRRHLPDTEAHAEMERQIQGAGGNALRTALADLLHSAEIEVEGFVPGVAVQGEIEQAIASDVIPGELELIEAYLESGDSEPPSYWATIALQASADVTWLVSAPDPFDLEDYGGLVEGDRHGGGFIHEVEASELLVTLAGCFDAREGWSELEILTAKQSQAEREARGEANRERRFRREQELGLWPSDEWIAEHDPGPPSE